MTWDYDPKQVISLAQSAIDSHKSAISSILALDGPRTFSNTIIPLTQADLDFDQLTNPLIFLKSVSPSKELIDAVSEAENLLDAYNLKISMDEKVYQTLKEIKSSKEYQKINKEDKRYIDKSIEDFDRSGIGMPKEKKEKILKLSKEMSEIVKKV